MCLEAIGWRLLTLRRVSNTRKMQEEVFTYLPRLKRQVVNKRDRNWLPFPRAQAVASERSKH